VKIFTEDETSLCLHVGKRTLQRWRTTGEGPRWVRLGPRLIGYPENEIDVWVAARTYASCADEFSRNE
jgi:predicted DNA-binding transcriptional regulator AlpA